MRHARHDAALNAGANALRVEVNPREQRYILIIYDGPKTAIRDASYISNVDNMDVFEVCSEIAQTIKKASN